MATLTYNYADSTAVLGPLATFAEPHCYDLCAFHAERLTAPRGWGMVRLVEDFTELDTPADDLLALADALRAPAVEAPPVTHTPRSTSRVAPAAESVQREAAGTVEVGRRGHLRVLRSE